MKEIGGYIELEHYHGEMLHEEGLKLNCGRNCLDYLIQTKKIRMLYLPELMCDSVISPCRRNDVDVRLYPVGFDLRPVLDAVPDDAWVYIMNYYGQYTPEEIREYEEKYPHIILDNAQAYFDAPLERIDVIYTCRKFFGVPDGAILYTDGTGKTVLEQSQSHENMEHLLGRFECGGSAFYQQSVENNRRMADTPVMRMSMLTENLLRSIDYTYVKERRTRNFLYLAEHLGKYNRLRLRMVEGAFAYPLFAENAAQMREFFRKRLIYVPVLWPNVLRSVEKDSTAYQLADGILPLPCDQRYTEHEMAEICKVAELFFTSALKLL